jgi:dTDP-4-dehydrorhamnose 3,5-epimerase
MKPLEIEGAWVFEPQTFTDARGSFHEWLRGEEFRAATGHDFTIAQANCTTSRRGTIRGIHFTNYPPGQAKYVTCARGSVMDVVVDIRVGSPTYGRWSAVHLDDVTHRAIYIESGLAHAYTALSDDAVMVYLCSTIYNPARERDVHPLDPEIGVAWPQEVPFILSDKDKAAPTLEEARERGILPSYAELRSAAH